MGHGFDSEDRHKLAAYIVGDCGNPWIDLP